MSIQDSINRGVAIAGALYTQTPNYAAKKEAALEKRELDKIDKGLDTLNIEEKELKKSFGSEIKNASNDIKNLENALELHKSLNKDAPEFTDPTLVKALKDVIKTEKEGIKNIKITKGELEKTNKSLGEDINDRRIELMKRKSELTGDYTSYFKILKDDAINRSKAIRETKKEQIDSVSNILNMQTNLGGTIADLKLNDDQITNIEKQLKDKGKK